MTTPTQNEYLDLDPAQLAAIDRYKLLVGSVIPRPIAFVSTISAEGVANLAPYSFFNAVSAVPMVVQFCPANDGLGREKDTLRNAKPVDEGGTGEFVVNVATHAYASQMAAAAEPLGPDESEFDFVGLSSVPSVTVKAPSLLESPVSFECRTKAVIRLAEGQPMGGNIVIGEVVRVRIRRSAVNERMHVDPQELDLVGRLGGLGYCTTRDRFSMEMGRASLGQ